MSNPALSLNLNLDSVIFENPTLFSSSHFQMNPGAVPQIISSLVQGNGTDSINQVFFDQRILTSGSHFDYNLYNMNTSNDPLGNAYTMAHLKMFFLQILGNLGCDYVTSVVLHSTNGTGSGYTTGDNLTVVGGSGSGGHLLAGTVSGGAIFTVTVPTPGASYLVGDVVTVTGGTGTYAAFTVTAITTGGGLASLIPAYAGHGYLVNDVLTLAGGTGTSATLKVTAVGGSGAVTAVSVLTPGSYTVDPTLNDNFPTGGTGTGVAFDVTVATTVKGSQVYVDSDFLEIGGTNNSNAWAQMIPATPTSGALFVPSGTLANPTTILLFNGGGTGVSVGSSINNSVRVTNSGSNPIAYYLAVAGSVT